jgi:hypothetical protein
MRNTQKVKEFIKKWGPTYSADASVLFDYKSICKNLLYEDEELVIEVIKILLINIELWATKESPIYSTLLDKDFVEKKDLLVKEEWFVKKVISRSMKTSGSTTGESFGYLRWEEFLYFIECENHYDLVLDEFNINNNPNILFFIDIGIKIKNTIEVKNDSKNFMEHHGLSRKANVHYINFDQFRENRNNFFKKLISHIKNNKIDVILATGPNINSLCNYIKQNEIDIKLASLLSNTNEKLLPSTISYIKENNLFDSICDHMRCWDGGATFFTCRDENYHLMDNLSWCIEKDNKLISTDYFSLASPFVNYWNGDLCKIDNNYKRCDCGRLYRDFEFLENRPFLIKGRNIIRIKEELSRFNSIKEVRCSKNYLELVSNEEIGLSNQKTIETIINKLLNNVEENERDIIKLKFLVENYGQNKG